MDHDLLTVGETARLLKVNLQTVRKTIDRGELPVVRLRLGRIRVRRVDLAAFLAKALAKVGHLRPQSRTRIAFTDAEAAAQRALRGPNRGEAATALRNLSRAAAALADEFTAS